MANVLIRGVPDETHAALMRRAEERGQSLQQYLAAQLDRLAATPTLDEVLTRVEQHTGGRVGIDAAVSHLAEERAHR